MNKVEILARIDTIKAEMEQTKAMYAKLEGHLAEAAHWQTELLKKETEESQAVADIAVEEATA